MIEKIRSYMAGHAVSDYNKSLIESYISMLETGQFTENVFKIAVAMVLQINVDDL